MSREADAQVMTAQRMSKLVDWYIGDQGLDEEEARRRARQDIELDGWTETGLMDSRAGVPLGTLQELIEANQELHEHPDTLEYEAYVGGYKKYEQLATMNGRTVDEQREYDANGGNYIWRND